ncbi:uncharacterized protein LOC111862476 [Cryptotermes secundus]|uniref:uncharacterized protein LOC111862476 n=1 Tax=Cryptotermes secundus TaxID=105785 RepID=UPI001454CFA4|nr:uncharacterized protein LOC111862476 [Cryptotermes secundus]
MKLYVTNERAVFVSTHHVYSIEIIILAFALITSAEESKCTEKDVNNQTKREDSTLEHEIDSKDELSLGKDDDLKEKQQERNELAANEENMLKHLETISEFEGHQDNEQFAKEVNRNQGQQLQDEENTTGQNTGKEKQLNVDIKQTQGEAEESELQYDVKEMDENGNDREPKEKKHTNPGEATLEQKHKLNSVEQHSDQQTAQNHGSEFRQHGHLEQPLEGYRVTETGQDEGHQLIRENNFNYLFNYHGGHNLQHSPNIFEDTSLHKNHDVQTLTLTDEVSLQHHFPVYIPGEKHVPQPTEKTVSFPAKQFVSHPAGLHYAVHKPVPYPLNVPVQRPYFVPEVPFAVHVRVPVPQSYTVHDPKPYTVLVEKKVAARYPVRVQVPVSQPYPVKVNVPVKASANRPVSAPVEEPYPVTVQKEAVQKKFPYPVQVHVKSPYPVPAEKSYPAKIGKGIPYTGEKKLNYTAEKNAFYPVKVSVDKPIPVAAERPYPVPAEGPYPVKVPAVKHVFYPVEKAVLHPIEITVPSSLEKAKGSKEEGGTLEDSFGVGYQG